VKNTNRRVLSLATMALFLGLWTTSCGRDPELKTLTLPDLSGNEPVVVQQIETRFKAVSQMTKGKDGAKGWGELGMLFNTYFFKEAAEICYANAATLDPSADTWPYLQGSLFLYWGRLEEAIAELNRAHELDKQDMATAISLARAYIQANQPDAAKPLFEAVLKNDQTSAAAWFGMGILAAKAGDHQSAVDAFQQALTHQPQASSVSHALGMSLRALGRLDEARTALESGGDVPVTFPDPEREKIAALGKSSTFLMMLAEKSLRQGRSDIAANYYRDAIKSHATLVSARLALVGLLELDGDAAAALELLGEGLRLPDLSNADRVTLLRRAAPLLERGQQSDDAIASLATALRLAPDPQIAMELARTQARAGQFKQALIIYNQVFEDQGENPALLVERARLFLALDKKKEARADLKSAIALDARNCFIRLEYARTLEQLGDMNEAAQQWAEADTLSLAGRPERVAFIKQKALDLGRKGKLEAATQVLNETLSSYPDASDLRWLLGRMLGQLDRFEDAMKELDRVVKEQPTWRAVRMNRASACLMANQYEAARTRLSQDLSHNPADRVLAHALARLLATAPITKVRDGAMALDLAQKVWDRENNPTAAETLAMAMATAGGHEDAENLVRRLGAEAREGGDEERARYFAAMAEIFASKQIILAKSGREILEAAAGVR